MLPGHIWSHQCVPYLVGDLRSELPGLLELRQLGADVEGGQVARRRQARVALAVVVSAGANLKFTVEIDYYEGQNR